MLPPQTSTYRSEVLARTKQYRDNSYFYTPSKVDEVSEAAHVSKETTNKLPVSATDMIITSPTVPTGTITMEHRSLMDDAEQTTDDEKDMYSTLVQELKRIDNEDTTKNARQALENINVKDGSSNNNNHTTTAKETIRRRNQVKMQKNLQGEEIGIGSQISTIEHVNATTGPLELDELDKSRAWR